MILKKKLIFFRVAWASTPHQLPKKSLVNNYGATFGFDHSHHNILHGNNSHLFAHQFNPHAAMFTPGYSLAPQLSVVGKIY
jgi:hypothetical protein